ncbi:hypothetical protein THASP1DRAFT_23691 [Thamnocephalis sphaerospora]|uniref:Uncharacterized protein n=1 Tax=Thamnocephalis sphaerospora TaxID=78915 RepID=A0A4P9XQG1_9FUNG|nr:hypothetical protein THASP1DRAFT_23691 [Thamnocephalis sphaerospora]|eukprot:RKP08276.1 hypothetical protein THASP1DRAFT_23691 [Thamnocephalis sphaerospora]
MLSPHVKLEETPLRPLLMVLRSILPLAQGRDGSESVRMAIASSPTANGLLSGFAIRLRTGNIPAPDGAQWIVPLTGYQPIMHWFDLVTTPAAAAVLLGAIYIFLFGQPRLRTWGVVQRYAFRNQLLQKAPTGTSAGMLRAPTWVACENPQFISSPLPTGQDSVALREQHMPSSQLRPTSSWQRASTAQGNAPVTPAILQRLNAIEARLSTHNGDINALRAFRDRVAMFYLRDDLFRERVPIADRAMRTESVVDTGAQYDTIERESVASSWYSGYVPYSPTASQHRGDDYNSGRA